jgi:hypothetical protein
MNSYTTINRERKIMKYYQPSKDENGNIFVYPCDIV